MNILRRRRAPSEVREQARKEFEAATVAAKASVLVDELRTTLVDLRASLRDEERATVK